MEVKTTVTEAYDVQRLIDKDWVTLTRDYPSEVLARSAMLVYQARYKDKPFPEFRIVRRVTTVDERPIALATVSGAWFVGKVTRPDAGGDLYNACRIVNNNEIEEADATPSHDRDTVQCYVNRLNRIRDKSVQRFLPIETGPDAGDLT